ncbi:MAG: outer membrane beta-barrel protein [Planctomycetes bacterium]|nr:outer membrane beta-barrel protein [Planctomycetota bacterium]
MFGSIGTGYTDNVLRGDHDAPGVDILREGYSRLEAGVRLDTELSDHRLEIGYVATVREHWRTGSFDSFTQRAKARLDLYGVDIEGHFNANYERFAFTQSVQLTGLVRLDVYSLRGWTELRVGRFGVRVGGSARRTDYLSSSTSVIDSWGYRADLQVYGRIQPKLRALVEYNWFVVEYDEGRAGLLNDYMAHQLRVGLDGAFTPKLSASLKVGATIQVVDQVTSPSRDRQEFSGATAEAAIGWKPFVRSSLKVAYRRTLEPSFQSNFLLNDTWLAEVGQKLFTGKLALSAFVEYGRSDVSRIGRVSAHINRFSTGLRAVYFVKPWLSLAGTYDWTRVGSPFANRDYKRHQVVFSIGAGL